MAALMAPAQPQQSNQVPSNIGDSENDMAAPGLPSTPPASPQGTPPNVGSSEQDMAAPGMGDQSQNQQNPATLALQQRLDALPNDQKAFLAQYLTPEFVHAMGLVAGPEVSQYLSQYTDPNKVLVPVSRQEAQRIQATVQQQQQGQGGQQPQQTAQGQPQPAPQQAQGKPTMAPQQQQPQPQMAMAQPPAQQLPNGVTPAPMQHGIMAPQA